MPLRNELIMERNTSIQPRPSIEALKRESLEIEMQIKQLQVIVYILQILLIYINANLY